MKNLSPDEIELIGKWIPKENGVVPDENCERIKWLVSNQLCKVGYSKESGAWETLFKDPEDGRFWVRTYPQSQMHGGGPPALRYVKDSDVKSMFVLEKE